MDNGGGFTRVLGLKDVLALAFGAMIGFGWVVLSGTWLQGAGSLGAIIAFLIGGVLVGTSFQGRARPDHRDYRRHLERGYR